MKHQKLTTAKCSRDLRVTVLAIALAVAIVMVFSQNVRFSFITYDDGVYLSDNVRVRSGLTWAGTLWALTTGHAGNWHPLTWISHMLDVELFGMNPGAHHGVSILLHIVNTVLLLLFLYRSTGSLWRSAFVASLFGLHPLHVESVVWAAERKDVLSAFFCMATLLAYARYSSLPNRRRFIPVLLGLVLGLMAKPMLVTLPVLLLLLDGWPLGRAAVGVPRSPGRRGPTAAIIEKLPLLVVALLSSVVTLVVQYRGGAVASLEKFPIAARVANALETPLIYLARMIWPRRLTLFYPFPAGEPSWGAAALFGALLLLITGAVLLKKRSLPFLVTGWFWYLTMLAPVSGLVQVGEQASADRYTYLPLIGIFMMVAWGVTALPIPRPLRPIVVAAGAAVVVASAAMSWIQAGYWRDSATLFGRATEVTRENWLAHNNLGVALLAQGDLDSAARHFAETLRIRPGYGEALNNSGIIQFTKGQFAEAAASYREAIRAYPSDPDPPYNLGLSLTRLGRLPEAEAGFRRSLELRPDALDPQIELAKVLLQLRREPEAGALLETALRIDPGNEWVNATLGAMLVREGRIDQGIQKLQAALRANPSNAQAARTLRAALSRSRSPR